VPRRESNFVGAPLASGLWYWLRQTPGARVIECSGVSLSLSGCRWRWCCGIGCDRLPEHESSSATAYHHHCLSRGEVAGDLTAGVIIFNAAVRPGTPAVRFPNGAFGVAGVGALALLRQSPGARVIERHGVSLTLSGIRWCRGVVLAAVISRSTSH
jgi:hypothetical protein